MLQIAKGMEYLHEQGILHGDLKTRNILVAYVKDGDKNLLSLKVADFGLVGTKGKSMSFVSRQARKLDMVRWKAPEKLDMLLAEDKDETSSDSDEGCTGSSSVSNLLPRTDVYSFAVMCSQILTGEDPYRDLNWKELASEIVSDELRPNLPPACPPSLRDLLVLCWSTVAAERPTFTVIREKLEHLQDITQTDLLVLVDDESRDVLRREQPKVEQGEELQDHQLEDEKEEHKEEGCSNERSPEAIFRLDKQGGSCSTATPSSTSVATRQNYKQLSVGNVTKYDVFLNHRGPDVKNTFVSHLEAALRRAGHDPVLDAKSLVKGQHASTSINESLAGVLVHVAVFSPGYAESKYCLNQLCDMLDSKKPVIPVFYNVEPLNLRCTERGPFARAFQEHLKQGRDKDVARWKTALLQAADIITGLRRRDYANDEELVGDIVDAVLDHLLGPLQLALARHPVGLEKSSSQVIQMLHKMEGFVRVVGICGTGGVGKTTLARHVYNQEQPSFANSCFLQDVKEAKGDAVKILQMKMLKDLAHEDAFDSTRWFERIRKQKVLLVIDDIGKEKLFEDLVPDLNELGFGSRVLVTSRKEDVLMSIMRDIPESEVYHIPELSYRDSLQLFTRCAFQKNNLEAVDAFFNNFVKEITFACGGLPLALEVMGGYLAHKKNLPEDEKYWNEALSALRTKNEIITKLRMSYDSLDEECKCMFLDIACFMLSHVREVELEIWKSNEQYVAPSWSLDQLVQRSLVKVDSDGQLSMHELLRDMGRNIVKEKASHRPEKLSHIWDPETAEKLLQKKQGVNEALVALSINGVDPGIACTAQTERRYVKWSHKVTWLQWRNFPEKELPSSLKLLNLVVLDLANSPNLVHVWSRDTGTPKLCPKLRMLKLSNCSNLKMIPSNITQFVNLKFLYLNRCLTLESLPDSSSELSFLETLDISSCTKLQKIPPSVCSLKKLRVLQMGLTPVVLLPLDFGQLESLTSVDFRGCGSLEDLPDSFSELCNLETLDLTRCTKLQKLPPSVCGLKKLRVLQMGFTAVVPLPRDFGQLQSLISIDFQCCWNLEDLPDSFSELCNLETLNLSRCSKLQKLPPFICGLKKLRVLRIGFTVVVHLPRDLGRLQSLTCIDFHRCGSLKDLPNSFEELRALSDVSSEGMTSEQLLLICASAMERKDVGTVEQAVSALQKMSSINGEPSERVNAYFLQALLCRAGRMLDPGAHELPISHEVQWTERRWSLNELTKLVDVTPYVRFGYTAANGALLEAFEGMEQIHILDFSTTHGMQWPTFIEGLADRVEGPPNVFRLTLSSAALPTAPRLQTSYEDVGVRLANYARLKNVPFQFHVLPQPLPLLTPAHFNLRDGEALGVNFSLRLHYLADESFVAPQVQFGATSQPLCGRDQLLHLVHSLNPAIVTLYEEDCDATSTDVVKRVEQSYAYEWMPFDFLATFLPSGNTERQEYEQNVGRKIENIVACEGQQRLERLESKRQWLRRMTRLRFRPLQVSEDVVSQLQDVVDHHNTRWGMKHDEDDCTQSCLTFASAWIPAP